MNIEASLVKINQIFAKFAIFDEFLDASVASQLQIVVTMFLHFAI